MANYPHQNPMYPYPYPPHPGYPPPSPVADPYAQPPPPHAYPYPYSHYPPAAPAPAPAPAPFHSGPIDYQYARHQQYPPSPGRHSSPLDYQYPNPSTGQQYPPSPGRQSSPLDYQTHTPPSRTQSGSMTDSGFHRHSVSSFSYESPVSGDSEFQRHSVSSFPYEPPPHFYHSNPESSQLGIGHGRQNSAGGNSGNIYPPVDELLENTHLADSSPKKNSFSYSSAPSAPPTPSVPSLTSLSSYHHSSILNKHQGSNISHPLLIHQGSDLTAYSSGHYRRPSGDGWERGSNHGSFSHSSSFSGSVHDRDMQIVPVQKGSLKVLLLHGNLDIWVNSAKNLPNMDMFHKTLGDMFGRAGSKIEGHLGGNKITSDPYVTISVSGAVVGRTFVISNCENPVWQQHFYVPVAHNAAEVHFLVKDSDVVGSELIGSVSIPVEQIYSGAKVEGTFPILNTARKQCKPGAVLTISIQYSPMKELSFYHNGVGMGPDYPGVPGTYFPLRKGGSVTLYQDAHVPDGCLPPLLLDRGIPYVHGKCWFDIFDAIRKARRLIYITGWAVWHKVRLVRDAGSIFDCPLGELLRSKSQEGVRVLLLIWDDPTSRSILGYKTVSYLFTAFV